MSSAVRRCLTLIALLLALVACGSGDDVSSEGSSDAAASSSESESEHGDDEHGDDDKHGDDDHDDEHGDDDHDDEHDDDSSGLGSHEHGTADLTLAWVENDIVINLTGPTQNVFGFEYEAETEDDRATVADRTDALTGLGILNLDGSAECELDDLTTELDQDGSHSEIMVSWTVACSSPAEFIELDLTPLFDEFPGFEDIDVEWLTATNQSATELSPSQPKLRIDS